MKSINIVPQAGLCNRLRVLFSYLEIAKQENKILNVFWKISDACNGHFLDVFNPIDGVNFIDNEPTSSIDYIGFNGSSKVEMSKDTYKSLVPINNILERIYSLSIEKYDAIHVRRTDHIYYASKRNRFMPDKLFENFIEKSKNKIFLACDCYETQNKFIDKYSNKIFINEIIQKSNNKRKTSLDNAVIDLFMCINSQSFFGTAFSSYSNLIKLLRN